MNDDELGDVIHKIKKKDFTKYIKMAAASVGQDNDFVRSCQSFLDKNGFLTEKQIEALENAEPFDDDYYHYTERHY